MVEHVGMLRAHTCTYLVEHGCFQDVAGMLKAYVRACKKREFQCHVSVSCFSVMFTQTVVMIMCW